MAMQNLVDEHDTESRLPRLMWTGALQLLPSYVAELPEPPTPTQKVAETQDTEVSSAPVATGALQPLPLYVNALPLPSKAMQKEDVGQETDMSWLPGSIKLASLQVPAL
jgi:hypothetical protein